MSEVRDNLLFSPTYLPACFNHVQVSLLDDPLFFEPNIMPRATHGALEGQDDVTLLFDKKRISIVVYMFFRHSGAKIHRSRLILDGS